MGEVTLIKDILAGAEEEKRRAILAQTLALAPSIPFDELWTPEPEASLVVPAMGLCPGPVHLVAGSWYTGKTLFLMSVGLAVASGMDVWGLYGAKRGRWLHFDLEMGRRHVKRYLHRVQRGMGIEPESLRGHIDLKTMPTLNLTTDSAQDHYCRLLEGVDLCTMDPLRAAAPGQDENSSEYRQWIDLLNRVSDRTGCAIMVLHHGGKPVEGSARRNTGRGTSAIDDAVQSKFVLTAEEKGAPIHVSHEKTRELAEPMADFWLELINEPDCVRICHLDPEQMEQAQSRRNAAKERSKVEKASSAIAEVFGRYAGQFRGTRAQFLELVKGDRNVTSKAFTDMCANGQIDRFNGGFRYAGMGQYESV